jgi:hypothetical protein
MVRDACGLQIFENLRSNPRAVRTPAGTKGNAKMRKFKSNEDLYSFIGLIIDDARTQGENDFAQVLQSAFQNHFITTEILGELSIALKKIQLFKNNEFLQPYRSDIKSAINYITTVR